MKPRFEKIVKDFNGSTFRNLIGYEIVEIEEGKATVQLPVQSSLMNAGNFVHGGIYATVLDSTMGLAARSIKECNGSLTIQIDIQFLKSINKGMLIAEANVINNSRSTALVEGKLFDEDRNLIAHSTGAFKLMRAVEQKDAFLKTKAES